MSHPVPVAGQMTGRRTRTASRTASVLAALVGVGTEALAIAVSSPAGPPGGTRPRSAPSSWPTPSWGSSSSGTARATRSAGSRSRSRRPGASAEALVATSYAVLAQHPDARLAALGSVLGAFLRGAAVVRRRDVAAAALPGRAAGHHPAGPLRRALHPRHDRGLLRRQPVLPDADGPARASTSTTRSGRRRRWRRSSTSWPAIALLLGIVAVGLAVAVLVQKYRRGGPLGRQQTLIFGAAFLPPLAAMLASFSDAAGPWLFAVATIPLPIAIGVAVLQRRLYDIQLAVNRSLTYGTLWLAIAVPLRGRRRGSRRDAPRGPDAVVAAVAGGRASSRSPSRRCATPCSAARTGSPTASGRSPRRCWPRTGAPARGRRRRPVAAALPRRRTSATLSTCPTWRSPTRTGRRLARRGAARGDVDRCRMTVVRRRGRHARAGRGGRCGTPTGSSSPTSPASSAPSCTRSACSTPSGPRRSGSCSPARRSAGGCGATCTTASARRSPACCCTSTRCATSCAAGSAPTRRRPPTRGCWRSASGIQGTVADVRRIVEGLRPPALDELGLAEAVTQLADRLTAGAGLTVEVHADELPRLAAAVEVAAYRITQEALTNVLRHAGARSATVRLGCARGGSARRGPGRRPRRGRARGTDGVGLASMRERAEEIGGTFAIDARPGAGTTISAFLPTAARAPADPSAARPCRRPASRRRSSTA